jgi:poly(A) polymerase
LQLSTALTQNRRRHEELPLEEFGAGGTYKHDLTLARTLPFYFFSAPLSHVRLRVLYRRKSTALTSKSPPFAFAPAAVCNIVLAAPLPVRFPTLPANLDNPVTMENTWGITVPISTALPTEEQKRASEALAKELRAQGTFEAPSETQKRENILKDLQKIADEFVKRAAAEKFPKHDFLIRDARGRIFTYGSYRLGVYGPGSDMDTLVVAPRYVDVDQYFKIFPDLLMEMAPKGAITDLNPVPDAFVPIIKFEFHNISIDLIFCSIQSLKELPDDKDWNLHNNDLLRGLNENQVRSLNGTRVTDEILKLVPEPATFRLAIRAIKLWAQRKAVYANILGYPGGIAWNIMVARVCQLYPKATSAQIVNKFFGIMLKWPWPQPVVLKNIEYGLTVTQVAVWNPKVCSLFAFSFG